MKPVIASLLLSLGASVSFADGHCGVSTIEPCLPLTSDPVDAALAAERERTIWNEFIVEQGGVFIILNQSQTWLNEAFS